MKTRGQRHSLLLTGDGPLGVSLCKAPGHSEGTGLGPNCSSCIRSSPHRGRSRPSPPPGLPTGSLHGWSRVHPGSHPRSFPPNAPPPSGPAAQMTNLRAGRTLNLRSIHGKYRWGTRPRGHCCSRSDEALTQSPVFYSRPGGQLLPRLVTPVSALKTPQPLIFLGNAPFNSGLRLECHLPAVPPATVIGPGWGHVIP